MQATNESTPKTPELEVSGTRHRSPRPGTRDAYRFLSATILACLFAATAWGEGYDRPCHPIDAAKELVITHPSVVDARETEFPGHWSVGYLFGQLAGERHWDRPVRTSNFVKHFLEQFATRTSVSNGNRVRPRPAIRPLVLDSWPRLADGVTLDFSKAPFRLLAITNRVDLKVNKSVVGGAQAGEGRFVFGVLAPDGTPLPFTVIFEYSLPVDRFFTEARWAALWHELSGLPFSTPSDHRFNQALGKITRLFSTAIHPAFPNDVSLNQIRTNEIALVFDLATGVPFGPWELRQFVVASRTGTLEESTVSATPDLSFNTETDEDTAKSLLLKKFLRANGALATLPTAWLGASAPVLTSIPNPDPNGLPGANFKWFPTSTDKTLRAFSANTCNGCHAGDTGTVFLHVAPRESGNEAQKSDFLKADTVNRAAIQKTLLRSAGVCL